jgi:cell division protein FtsB
VSLKHLSRPLRRTLLVALPVVALYFVLGGAQGISRFYHLHTEVARLETEVAQARATADSLQHEIARLRSDTTYIEYVARKKLGMARTTERVYKFVEDKGK